MSFSTELLALMPDTIKISTRTGHNNYGEASYAASTSTHAARILEKPGFIHGEGSEEVAYRHVLWVRSTGTTKITATDRLKLPDGTTPPIVAVERYPDEDGPNHVVIKLGY